MRTNQACLGWIFIGRGTSLITKNAIHKNSGRTGLGDPVGKIPCSSANGSAVYAHKCPLGSAGSVCGSHARITPCQSHFRPGAERRRSREQHEKQLTPGAGLALTSVSSNMKADGAAQFSFGLFSTPSTLRIHSFREPVSIITRCGQPNWPDY